MNQAGAVKAIFDRWSSLFPGRAPGILYGFDNQVIAEPDNASFARVGVDDNTSELYTLGPHGSQQRTAYIKVRLTGPVGVGRGPLDALIDVVRGIYERVRFASGPGEYGIVTHASTAKPLRKDRDAPQLWVVQVLTPCEWYESR